MGIKTSDYVSGKAPIATPLDGGVLTSTRFRYEPATAALALAAGDIVDIGVLPANSHIVDAYAFTDGDWTGVKADVGLMSGEPGSTDAARTCGAEVFSQVDLAAGATAIQRMTLAAGPKVERTESHRSIGLKVSAAVAAAAGKRVTVVLVYAQ